MLFAQLLKSANIPVSNLVQELLSQSVSAVVDQHQQVIPNSIFVAVQGFRNDGHDFVVAAEQQGAALAIVENAVPARIPQIVVPNSRIALANLSAAFWDYPAHRLQMLGVTGTNGKTTTTQLIHHILSQRENTGLIGSVHVKMGQRSLPSTLTTPPAPQLHRTFQKMLDEQVSSVVMEVSSHGLELHRVAGVPFSIVGITNISADHIDLHHSLENYIRAKARLFQMVRPSGFGLYNIDDPLTYQAAIFCSGRLLSYGTKATADFRWTRGYNNEITLDISRKAQSFLLKPLSKFRVELPLLGTHNIYNSVLAASIAFLAGVDSEKVDQGLRSFPGVTRRLQTVHNDGFTIIDDYAHNPDGIKVTLEAVTSLEPRSLIVVFAIRGNRGIEINAANGQTLYEALTKMDIPVTLITTLSSDAVGDNDAVSLEEREAFYRSLKNPDFAVIEEPLLEQALQTALHTAQKGDVILLLGAQGMDQAQSKLEKHLPLIANTDPYPTPLPFL